MWILNAISGLPRAARLGGRTLAASNHASDRTLKRNPPPFRVSMGQRKLRRNVRAARWLRVSCSLAIPISLMMP